MFSSNTVCQFRKPIGAVKQEPSIYHEGKGVDFDSTYTASTLSVWLPKAFSKTKNQNIFSYHTSLAGNKEVSSVVELSPVCLKLKFLNGMCLNSLTNHQ